VGQALERRQRGQAPEIINISWKAQRRLNARWRQLKDTRRKPNGIVAVAIARELAAYCWEIATCPLKPDPVPSATPTTSRRFTNSRYPHLDTPVAACEAARAPRLAHTTPRSVA